MNKRLLALWTASLFAVSAPALAMDVQLFGFLDQGLAYIHEDLNYSMHGPRGGTQQTLDADGYMARQGKFHSVSQGTGNVSTWGIKGSEKLTEDVDLIFHIENGFLPDSGEFYISNYLFERESSLGLRSKRFGELKMGRMPALTTGSGTTGIFNSRVNPFGAGWGNMTGGWKFTGTLATARHNNMLNYISPSFNGVRFFGQHSFGDTNDETEGTSKTSRWSAVGVNMTGERFYLAAAVDWLKKANNSSSMERDSWKALVGGHYKFDDFKLFGTFQYMKNIAWIGGYSTKEYAPLAIGQTKSRGFEAWSATTGVDVPCFGGTFKLSLGYAEGENQNVSDKKDFSRVNAGVGYVYPFSRRTSVYLIGGYFWQDADWQRSDIEATEVIAGLMHRF